MNKYSGPIYLATVIQITGGHCFVSIYTAYLFQWALVEIDFLTSAGLLFVIGQGGNFYHHKLLADLRKSETA